MLAMEEPELSLAVRFASFQCTTPQTRPQPIFYREPDVLILVVDQLIAPVTYRQFM